jgi:basic membrane protein A
VAQGTIDIFISYTRGDTRFVDRLETGLHALGFTTWVDRRKLESGQNWERELQGAIDRARAVVVVLSPAAVDSDYVRAEYSYAIDKKKPVVPLVYRPCEVPLRLRILQWVTYAGSLDTLLADLRQALRTHGVVPTPPAPSAPPTPGSEAPNRTPATPAPVAARSRRLPLPSARRSVFLLATALLLPTLILAGVLTNNALRPRGTNGPSPTKTVPVNHIRVGLVTDDGGLGDHGFNALAYQGLQQAKSKLGAQVDVTEPKGATEYVPDLEAYASQGYDLVIAVGFLMQAAVGTAAQHYPRTHFAIVDGAGTDADGTDLKQANVMDLVFKEQDAGASVGVIAGMLEKNGQSPKRTNSISAIGGYQIPPVDHYIAGYRWAAQLEDPGITVRVGYSSDFVNAAACRDLANSQISGGSDILLQVAGACGTGVLQVAGQRGVYSIGVDTDQKSADHSVIASVVKKVDVAVYFAIKTAATASFVGGQRQFGLADGGVGYAPGNLTLTPDIVAEIQRVSDQVKAGTLQIPDTP